VVVAAALVAAASLGAPSAGASRFIQKGIYDDAQILYGNPDRVFYELGLMKTQVIRVNLWWGGPTGVSVAKRRPANAADPEDPAYDWATYDRTVRFAAVFRMQPMFSIVGTPGWANRAKGWNAAPSNPQDLRLFAAAAQRRYSGAYRLPDGTVLPRVGLWTAWNEPNNPVFLKPQYVRSGGAWVIQSAKDYGAICNAVVEGVKASRKASKVACGVTAPRGNNQPGTIRSSVSPLAFLRAMWSAGARGFDAYAHHPYYGTPAETPSTPPPPGKRGQPPTAVTLGNFDTLVKELKRLYGNKRIWVTEYGYQTNPPDRLFGVSPERQALYMKEAWDTVRAHPLVDYFIWFLVRDEQRLEGWQSGVFTKGWKRKPSRETFERLVR
jgi:hypothetical protein